MKSCKERVIKSLKWDNPNSLIVEGGFSPATWLKYREELEPIADRIANDFYKYRGSKNDYDEMPASYRKGDSFKDTWGCIWECKVNGMQGIITHHPLKNDWEGFDSFVPPDPDRTSDLTAWDQKAFEDGLRKRVQDKKFIIGGSGERLWERVHFL